MKKEKALIIIKPGFIKYEKPIFAMLEKLANVKVSGRKKMRLDEEILSKHYAEHVGKSFYPTLAEYMSSEDVIVAIAEGNEGAVERIRTAVGFKKDPAVGTIREKFGFNDITKTVVHASDSVQAGEREIEIFYEDSNIKSI